MVVQNSEIKMRVNKHYSRIDTAELKVQIGRKLGRPKAEKYFNLLSKYLSLKLSKPEFNKLCIGLVGSENIFLHNEFIQAILKNASLSKTPPAKKINIDNPLNVNHQNGYPRSSLQSLCRDVFPQSPKKGRTSSFRERRFNERTSPLGKTHSVACENSGAKVQESATELLSLGSRPPVEVNSVEEGEEVEQAFGSPGIYSRSPVRAPLGISMHTKETRKVLRNGSAPAFHSQTCHNCGELPETGSLKIRLEQKLDMEGLKISTDCVSLLNNGLDVFLKRLMKPCLDLAGSRSKHKNPNRVHYQPESGSNGLGPMRYVQKPNRFCSASILDFRVAMESNPRLLGEDWPVQLEKICLHSIEESSGINYEHVI